MRSVSIVVTCTDRKSMQPGPGLRVRDLPKGDLNTRLEQWNEALAVAPLTAPLEHLYQGESWAASLGVATAAAKAGFMPQLKVMSAGLGLRASEDRAPGYAATLSPDSEDVVGDTLAERQQWWRGLQAAHGNDELAELSGPVLLVLSDAYARVLQPDLAALAAVNRQVVLFGGADDVEGVTRVPANGRLRRALGGTMSALNARTAAQWWALTDREESFASSTRMRALQEWAGSVEVSVRYDRTKVPDADVREWIRAERERDPRASRSVLHRRFRDSGYACEQKRFSNLFKDVEMCR